MLQNLQNGPEMELEALVRAKNPVAAHTIYCRSYCQAIHELLRYCMEPHRKLTEFAVSEEAQVKETHLERGQRSAICIPSIMFSRFTLATKSNFYPNQMFSLTDQSR